MIDADVISIEIIMLWPAPGDASPDELPRSDFSTVISRNMGRALRSRASASCTVSIVGKLVGFSA